MRKVFITKAKLTVLRVLLPPPSPTLHVSNVEYTNRYCIKRRINLGEACMYLHVVACFLVCGFVLYFPMFCS